MSVTCGASSMRELTLACRPPIVLSCNPFSAVERARMKAKKGAPAEGAFSVLHIGLETPETRPSGLNHYFANLFETLNDLGVAGRAVLVGREGRTPRRYVIASSTTAPLPLRLARIWYTASKIRADVVDAHFALHAVVPVMLARSRRTPVLVHFQGPWADESRSAGARPIEVGIKRVVERFVYRRADCCVVLSDAFGDLLSHRYGVPRWAIRVIPPGVDLDAFSPDSKDVARARLGIPEGCWLVVAVRRLMPRMGLDVLLDAWSELAREGGQAMALLIVGDGPERVRLERRLRQEDLKGTTRLLGKVDDDTLLTCYQAADVSVVPSVELEGFGLVVLESLAAGTPVIGSTVGGLPEVLVPLAPDLVVPTGEPSALAKRLKTAAAPGSSLPSATDCRRYAEGFSWSMIGRRHVELYRSVIRSAHVPTKHKELRLQRTTRVVVLDHTGQLSGAELAMSRLVPALHNVDVHFILAEEGPFFDLLISKGISAEVLPLPRRSRRIRKDEVLPRLSVAVPALLAGLYTIRLAARLRQLRPDLIHTNTLKSALYGGVASKLAGVPCLWHIRDRIETDYLPKPAVTLVRRAARLLSDYTIANSHTTLATLNLPQNFGEVVPSPVDVRPVPRLNRRGSLRVGMVGRIAPWKGQDIFVRAFAAAFRGGQETAAIIGAPLFGEECYLREVEQLIERLGLDGRIQFRGFQAEMSRELDDIDVLVHASRVPEPFGQVVVEGMAAGLPVVAADAGGPSEVINDGTDGFLYPVGDHQALAARLLDLSGSVALRETLGQNAQGTAMAYCPATIAQKMERVYGRLATGRGFETQRDP